MANGITGIFKIKGLGMRRTIFGQMAIVILLAFSYTALAGDISYSTKPVHSPSESKKWRIGYLQGGEYIDYKETLIATVEGLMELGWILYVDTQRFADLDAETIWKELADKCQSDYVCFVKDAFYNAGWQSDRRQSVANAISQRIQKNGDIDLIFAMGTWAGQDLSKLPLDTNVLVMTASDPVAAGIIKSPYDSGAKNLHAHTDPTIYERQIRLFHEITQFKKLGIIFEDSLAGRSYAGLASAERVSKELGFDIVACSAVSDIPDRHKCEQEYLDCIDKIASEIDALYISVHGGVTDNSIPTIVERSKRHRIPTFSQSGSKEVEKGFLMSLSRISFKKVGLFQAAIIANIFNGAKPGDLVQVFEEPLNILLNIDTSQSIGFLPSADFIAAADILCHKDKSQE